MMRSFMVLFCENLVCDVNLNDNFWVYSSVEVWMVLLDELPVGSVDLRLRCAVGDTQDFIGASVGSRICVGLLLGLLLLPLVVAG